MKSAVRLIRVISLFAISLVLTFSSIAQVIDLTDLPRINTGNIEPSLYRLVEAANTSGIAGAAQTAMDSDIKMIDGKVKAIVQVKSGVSVTGIIPALSATGAEVRGTYDNLIQVLAPLDVIEDISAVSGVDFVRLPYRPNPEGIISEGVNLTKADMYQTDGFTGKGVKIAIVDAGFSGYEALIGTELPENTIVKSFLDDIYGNGDITAGGQIHGTACAEIVHDMAPEAQLYLVNFGDEVELSYALDWLISEGVDIISHSIGWINTGPYDGTGIICNIAKRAYENGILWVNSSGNYARRHYEGTFRDTNGNGFHEYSYPNIDETIAIWVTAGYTISVFLSWDAWYTTNEDYDLYLLNEQGDIVASSTWDQRFSGFYPIEEIYIKAPETGYYYIAVHKRWATRNHHLEIYSFNNTFRTNNVQESSLNDMSTSPLVCAVGATYWADDTLESFSSQGPTNDGRIKPDVSAPDGTNGVSYGPGGFFGTSASCPHVAGAAGLIKSMYPDLLPDQIKMILEGTALDLGEPGKDNLFGSGRLNFEKPGLHWVSYDPLNYEMKLEFGFPVMHNEICFDKIGVEADNSGSWDFALSNNTNLKAKNKKPDRLITLDLNHAHATTVNMLIASLLNHQRLDLLLKDGAFKYQFGYNVSETCGHDNMKVRIVADGYTLGTLGDVNGDGNIQTLDAGLILKASSKGVETLPISEVSRKVDLLIESQSGQKSNIAKSTADWNRDGRITSLDAMSMLNWLANGKISSAPALLSDEAESDNLPKSFALMQNYPNPFNPETWIPYQLAESADVTITIYNVNGYLIRQLKLGNKATGYYLDKSKAAYWDGKNEYGEEVTSGIYFYSIQAGENLITRKMIIAK